MTVQISILVWTVICFCLLMFILDKLLFRPMLNLMDERRTKINNAAAKKAEIEKSQQEYEKNLLKARDDFRKSEAERTEKMLQSAKDKAEKEIAEAEAESRNRIELAKIDIEYEKKELNDKLGKNVDALADAFISRLIS